MNLKIIIATNNLKIIEKCYGAIDRIMIDFENHTYDSLDGPYTIEDLKKIRLEFPDKDIVIRLARESDSWDKELINELVSYNPNYILAPMIKSGADLERLREIVPNNIEIIPMIETPESLIRIKEIASCIGTKEAHIGLHDLGKVFNTQSMSRIIASGLVDYLCHSMMQMNLKYGFIGYYFSKNKISYKNIIQKHLDLYSSRIIFHSCHLRSHLQSENYNDYKNFILKYLEYYNLKARR